MGTPWTINSSIMRIVKWSQSSHQNIECPIALVWLAFYNLPIHFFDKTMLFSIAAAFGHPLKVDEPTANLTRPLVARVLVEVDVSKEQRNKIWLGTE